jgi:two-component system chemotaxis response regulator CheY
MFPFEAKILIVDDSSFARTMLKSGLRELKYSKILEATDAKIAKGLFIEQEQVNHPVHLLICDIHMPDMSGLELLKWVRAQERLKKMPVIILTSSQEKTEILEAGKLGVSHYMVKPFDTLTLKDKISSTWQKHGQKFFESVMKRPS